MKKIAIKKLLVAVAIATATNLSFAQTPYDSFAPTSEKKEILKLPETTFRAYNTDTTSESRYIELDKEMYTISYFNENDSLLKTVQLEPTAMKWWSVDPHASNYPDASPYNFVNNNPILNIDPDGRDWFKYTKEGADKTSWNWHDGSTYEHKTGVDADGNDVFETLQGYQAVVTFEGSRNEKLGEGDNLFGKGAVLANVTVYGPGGADDIQNYKGFTMSSNFGKYGAIDDGEYDVYYRNPGKSGALKSNWAVENTGPVDALDGVNPSPIYPYSPTQKDGIYIHRSNRNGWAGGQVSTGCLLICPTQYDIKGNVKSIGWDEFNTQLSGVSQFRLELTGRRR